MDLKKILLCLLILNIFALTGCVNYILDGFQTSTDIFNDKYSITEPTTSTDVTSNSSVQTNVDINPTHIEEKSRGVRYDQLTDAQKITYEEIYTGIENYSKDIYISQKIYQEDLEKVYDAIMYTANFELVYTIRKYDYKYNSLSGEITQVRPYYDISLEERNSMLNQVDEVAKKVVQSANGLDTFETVKLFHDYIITNCDYEKSTDNYSNAYGVFIEGKAVCEGYSRAFKYLCDMANIPCELVLGDADIDHMWNLVQIDGEWYHIDVTWDDPENKGGDYISYTYFNLSDSQIFVNHTINDTSIFPSATATDMNYFKHNNLCANTSEELYNLIYGEVYNACLNGDRYVYVSVNDKSTFDEAFQTLNADDWNVMFNIINNAYSLADVDLQTSELSCSYDEDIFTFTICLW